MSLSFLATGSALPEKILTNAELEKMVDTSDSWITERTGIKERRIAQPTEATSDFSLRACRQALERGGVDAEEVDLIVVATCTPDHLLPSTACLVQKGLGARKAVAFDLSAACSGFVYGLAVVEGLLSTGMGTTALLVGADTLSRITDWKDRSTCVLFGDGAGALLVKKEAGPSHLLSVHLGAQGDAGDILRVPGGGTRHPLKDAAALAEHPVVIQMEGKEVFRHAVTRMVEAAGVALKKAALKPTDITLYIPHQANLRIIDAVAHRLAVPNERVFRNVHKFGNMSAATTIVALDEAVTSGRLQRGDLVELIAFGGGLTWGAAVLRW